jgi:hypothetical protein
MPKPLSLLTAVLTAFAALAVAGVTSDWKEYTDNELHVAFRYPETGSPPLSIPTGHTLAGQTARFNSVRQKAAAQSRSVEVRLHTSCNLSVLTLK